MRPVSVGEDGGGEARCATQGATAATRGVPSRAEVHSFAQAGRGGAAGAGDSGSVSGC